MKGGFPAAHSKRSPVSAAHAKKSPSWTNARGARSLAADAAAASRSTPILFGRRQMNRPEP